MDDRLYREQREWLECHQKAADVIVIDTRTGQVKEALYYSPMKKAQDERDEYTRNFFQKIREAELE